MSKQRVVALITSHRVRIARALVRQIRALSSRYATIDPQALEMSLQRLLVAIARFLETGDDKSLRVATMNTAQLRQALGFRVDDFMSAGLSFLPVMRRFLVEQAPSVQAGPSLQWHSASQQESATVGSQSMPQPPQLAGSLWRSTQRMPHRASPAAQSLPHT